MMSEIVNITADSLPHLFKRIGNRYGIHIDDLWLADETLNRVGFNRLEVEDGNEPSDREKSLWKDGKLKMWLANYEFYIEARELKPFRKADFKGMKTHD